jgi:Acyl-CoA dehydrogenase, C-terminal domain
VLDRAIQVFGAEGMCQDQLIAEMYAQCRTLRIADGPDEVHQLYVLYYAEANRIGNLDGMRSGRRIRRDRSMKR